MKNINIQSHRDENIHIGRIISSFRAYKYYFLIAIVTAVILTALVLIFVPKEFKIEGRLELISNNTGMGSELKAIKSSGMGNLLGGGNSGANAEDQAMIILSHRILTKTIIEEGLQIDMTGKEGLKTISYYKNDAPYKLTFTSEFLEKFPDIITLEIIQKGRKTKFTLLSKSIEEKIIEEEKLPVSLSTPWGKIIVEKGPAWKSNQSVKIQLSPILLTFEKYKKELTIKPISTSSNLLELTIFNRNKEQGSALINALMQNYIQYTKSVKLQESEINQKFVEEKLQQARTELNQLERNIELYKRKNNIPDLQAYGAITYGGSEETNKRLLEAQTQLKMLTYTINYLKDSKNEYAIAPNIEYGADALSAYNQLMFKRLELLKSSEPSNSAVEILNEQLREQRKVLISTLQAAQHNMNFAINEIYKENSNYMARLGELPTQEKKYIEMVRLQKTQEALYLFLLQKKQEKEITNAPDEQAARILDYAYCSYWHVFPKGSVMLPTFLALCLVIAIIAAAIKEFVLKKTITEDSITDLFDATPWATFTDEESVKRLRRLIHTPDDQGGVFLVTSSILGEGKTFFASHLVKSLKETGHETTMLTIDASTLYTSQLTLQISQASAKNKYVFILAPSLCESSIAYDLARDTNYTFFLCRLGITTKKNLSDLNQDLNQNTLGKIALVVNKQ